MDWNAKWDWENLVLLNPKTVESFKKQTTEPLDLYEGQCSKSGSGLRPGFSARSSVSVCTESSVGSGEAMIGLKLGKRMYFENNSVKGTTKAGSFPEGPHSSTVSNVKKIKSSNPSTPSCCQVEGCNIDLSSAKEYHHKHKVCASHSKCPKVLVGGLERRFCQQCSRFHSLTEFDEKKRSCRKRLSDHNTRRRKPQLDPTQFNTMMMHSPFSVFTSTNGKQQMSIESTNVPQMYSRSFPDSTWESTFSTMFKTTKECFLKFEKTGTVDEQLQLPSKGTKSKSLYRGFKDPVLPPNLDPAPGYHRALSLLSNNDSWGSYPPSNNSIDHSVNVDHMHLQPLMQEFPQTRPEFCQIDHHSALVAANDTGRYQLSKPPYNDSLQSNLYNELLEK